MMPTDQSSDEQSQEQKAQQSQEPQPEAARPKKRDEDVITRSIESWADRMKSSRQSLLTVQLGQKGEPCLAYTYLKRELGCEGSVFYSRGEIINSVLQKMINENIVVLGHPSIANEWRRKLLFWYEGLSETEKKEIPVAAQVIASRASLYEMDGMKNLKWARAKLPLVAQTYNEIIEDLKGLGVITSDYKTVAERNAEDEYKKLTSPRKPSLRKLLNELRESPVTSYQDLVTEDPAIPFKKLLHIFAAASMGSSTDSTKSNYSEGFRYAVKHLKEIGFSGNEDTKEYFFANYLANFRKFLVDKIQSGRLSTHTADSLLSAVRLMYKRAIKIKGLGLATFIDIEGFKTHRKTDEYRPYPAAVRTQIKQACDSERLKLNNLTRDYVSFGGGLDPIDSNGELKRGFASLDNARWIFENKLNFRIIGPGSANLSDKYEKGFIRILSYVGLGLVETYEGWGVIYQVTSRHMAPYITRLAQITGLNADSLKSLNIDDFVECHELTQRPYLRYWKERSDGEKQLHLDLVEADLTWLTINQSKEVKVIFAEVAYLTRKIRARADDAVKSRLFIYESRKQTELGKIKSFENSTVVNLVMNQFARDHRLQSEDGEDLNISASRLRPSLVAELVEKGVSLREIQIVLGHKSLSTTIQYLDKLEFSKTARDVLESALAKIHKEAVAQEALKINASKIATTPDAENSPIAISNGLVKCRNVYDPPEEIKKLATYKKGSACSLLNKCLSCSNSIITAGHLPELFAMRREYQSMLATSTIGQTPYGAIIKENLEVLNSILTPSEQGFTAEQLDEAERLSEHIITSPLVEGVTL
ncbi:tyrosine-type recombinase/integrase [Pseudomonas syringae]|uniref:tyrosine-type recombinase/integrase n=2 Tax=Pseudomonas syringae TaxID=317 RepID=UPI00034CD95C|nr:tyrosine-type recombinase/integrase [Pseudomonas syringae]OSN80945.1 Tyrosine recombinase XerC [Pseudomonas syringae pv. actinidiae]